MLFEQNAIFRSSIEQCDAIILQRLNIISLVNEFYNSILPEFDDLLITHPAIIAFEIVLYKVLTNMVIVSDYVVWVSLGGFAAAVCGKWNMG